MKFILWGGVILLALFWTGAAALLVEAVQWSAQRMSSGSTATLEAVTGNIVLPVWLSPWLNPAGMVSILETLQDMLSSFSSVLPTMGMVMGWLVPAIWITWGLGMLLLAGMVVVGTLLLQRFYKSK